MATAEQTESSPINNKLSCKKTLLLYTRDTDTGTICSYKVPSSGQCKLATNMDRGRIPGYYYDEDKKKYFKIQANHVAPPDAKYARSNVNVEKRAAKKRRIEDRSREQRYKQTVRPSRVLEHALSGGVGLGREIGLRAHVGELDDRDTFFISQLRPTRREVPPPNAVCRFGILFDATSLGNSTVFSYNHAGQSSVYVLPPKARAERSWMPLVSISSGRCELRRMLTRHRRVQVAFNSPLVNVHTFSEGRRQLLIACTQEPKPPGNVFISLFTDGVTINNDIFLSVGGPDSSIGASSYQHQREQLALSGSEALFVLDIASATSTYRVPLQDTSRDVTWLNQRTIACGEGRKLRLFDTRSGGGATRFERSLPITAIESLDNSGVQLLVADNKCIALYDTRMEKMPLLGFAHVHQGPQLQLAVDRYGSPDGCIAALDINNDVQTYSLRTGKSLGTLQRPSPKGRSLLTKLRWTELEGGVPSLQACQDGGVVNWTFGDDEAA